MPFSSSSDEDDTYLGTKKLTNIHVKFSNFYQTKKLDHSEDEDIQPIVKTSPKKTPLTASQPTRAIKTRSKQTKVPKIGKTTLTLAISFDEEPVLPSTSFDYAINKDVVVNDAPKKSVDPEDVLRQLDELAETAKELSEDYGAALFGKSRKSSKRQQAVIAEVFKPSKGTKRTRTSRNSARLARLQIRHQLQDPDNIQSTSNHNETEIIELTDSNSDHNSDLNGKSPKRLKHCGKVDFNPTVQCNINWRCDSEITHKISVFKFQCLSCIEEFCCSEYNIDQTLILFTIDDKPVDLKQHCYASLKLTESSVIDGGVLPLHIDRPKVVQEGGLMRLKVQYLANGKTRDFPVHVKKDDCFDVIFWLIIQALGCDFEDILLFCDGSQVKATDSLSYFDLEENDCLDLTLNTSKIK